MNPKKRRKIKALRLKKLKKAEIVLSKNEEVLVQNQIEEIEEKSIKTSNKNRKNHTLVEEETEEKNVK